MTQIFLNSKSRILNPYHGFINLHKPIGITSADAVNRVKRIIRPTKIGHAGTLDPLATGVLPLALGEGTKCINLLMDAKKTYEFSVTFGERRSTDDAEGEVIATSDHLPSEAEICAVLPRFTGVISQTPPIYSALKVDGKRAYDLARAGEAVELQAREVVVYSLEYLGDGGEAGSPLPSGEVGFPSDRNSSEGAGSERLGNPGEGDSGLARPRPHPDLQPNVFDVWTNPTSPEGGGVHAAPLSHNNQQPRALKVGRFRAVVSKGTYIRSLGRDIALSLGTQGYISRLHRAAVGPFTDQDAISLDFLEKSVHKAAPPTGEPCWLTPLERALDDIPAVSVEGGQLQKLRQGQRIVLVPPMADTPQIAVLHQGKLVGLARAERGELIPTRLLLVEG